MVSQRCVLSDVIWTYFCHFLRCSRTKFIKKILDAWKLVAQQLFAWPRHVLCRTILLYKVVWLNYCRCGRTFTNDWPWCSWIGFGGVSADDGNKISTTEPTDRSTGKDIPTFTGCRLSSTEKQQSVLDCKCDFWRGQRHRTCIVVDCFKTDNSVTREQIQIAAMMYQKWQTERKAPDVTDDRLLSRM